MDGFLVFDCFFTIFPIPLCSLWLLIRFLAISKGDFNFFFGFLIADADLFGNSDKYDICRVPTEFIEVLKYVLSCKFDLVLIDP